MKYWPLVVLAAALAIPTEGLVIYNQIQQARNSTPQADVAPIREPAIARGAVAEAETKEAIARQSLRRQTAEADEAVARACNVRMEQLTKNMILSEVDMHTMTIKPGTRTARMQEEYDKDCDPTYNARKICESRFAALMVAVDDDANYVSPAAEQKLKDKVSLHMQECPLTDAQRKFATSFAKEKHEAADRIKAASRPVAAPVAPVTPETEPFEIYHGPVCTCQGTEFDDDDENGDPIVVYPSWCHKVMINCWDPN